MLWPCLRCADISYQTELLRRCLDQTSERDPRRSQDTTSTEQGAQPNAKPTQSSIWASFFRVALWVFTTRNTPWLNGLQCAVAPKAGNTATYSNHMGSHILFRLQFMFPHISQISVHLWVPSLSHARVFRMFHAKTLNTTRCTQTI